MTQRRRWLVAFLLLAAVEFAVGLWVHRRRIDDGDLDALADTLGEVPAGVPVLAAEAFVAPHLRTRLASTADLRWIGRPDLRGVTEFYVVGLATTWTRTLDAMLAGRPRPERIASYRAGDFRIARYRFARGERIALDFADAKVTDARADEHPCRLRSGRFDCGVFGRIVPTLAEIDYAPIRCLGLDVPDGTTVALRAEARGDLLRGHVGFSDFNARLRSDGAVRVEIVIDGETVGRFVVTDVEGLRPFEVALPGDGPVPVEIRIAVPSAGTFDPKDGYVPRPAHRPCLDARVVEILDGGGSP
ncbi:MAG: hypothetical protein D6705_11720 [Deltaproteobacteria bacterium]|nr:MAG: hypothetical protein D6705_11720 [Deltaproteobacteria bacterium]